MEEFHSAAYQYHRRFYSFIEYSGALKKHLLMTLVFGFSFFAACIYYFLEAFDKLDSNNFDMLGMLTFLIAFEIPFLLSYDRLRARRDALAAGGVSIKNMKYVLDKTKIRWINDRLNIDETQYSQIAKYFQDIRAGYDQNRHILDVTAKDLLLLVFDPSAKARIASFFILLLSICTLIIIKNIDSPEALFEIISREPFGYHLFIWLFISLSYFIVLIGIVYCISFILNSLSVIYVLIEKNRAQSNRVASLLIRDMLKYAQLPIRNKQKNHYNRSIFTRK